MSQIIPSMSLNQLETVSTITRTSYVGNMNYENVKKFTLAGEGQPQTHPKAAKEMDLNSKVARGTS
ncbi:hypothetical protein AMTRI_Chr01g130210 [Amborella trichopoda]